MTACVLFSLREPNKCKIYWIHLFEVYTKLYLRSEYMYKMDFWKILKLTPFCWKSQNKDSKFIKQTHYNDNFHIFNNENRASCWGWAAFGGGGGIFRTIFLSKPSRLNRLTDFKEFWTKMCTWESMFKFIILFIFTVYQPFCGKVASEYRVRFCIT